MPLKIRHVVLVNFKSDADVDAVASALLALKNQIPGILEISFGANNSPEPLARNNTHAFTVDFENAAARDAYLPHPAHKIVGAQIVAAAVGGLDGVTVLDWVLT